jgi:hypothetical protein
VRDEPADQRIGTTARIADQQRAEEDSFTDRLIDRSEAPQSVELHSHDLNCRAEGEAGDGAESELSDSADQRRGKGRGGAQGKAGARQARSTAQSRRARGCHHTTATARIKTMSVSARSGEGRQSQTPRASATHHTSERVGSGRGRRGGGARQGEGEATNRLRRQSRESKLCAVVPTLGYRPTHPPVEAHDMTQYAAERVRVRCGAALAMALRRCLYVSPLTTEPLNTHP